MLESVGAQRSDHSGQHEAPLLFYGAIAAIFAVLLIYSQTAAFTWDEGFHLLAAQLIRDGKRPYLDFCFPQTPLNAYWNATWMRLLGNSWRAAHAIAALLSTAAIALAADFVRRRFPAREWRIAGAVTTSLVLGLNVAVVEYGTIGQSYAFTLFLLVCGFRMAVMAAEREAPIWSGAAGLFSAGAAASSLLSAMAAPVVLIWILWRSRPGRRWPRFAMFVAGGAIPFLPVLWLFVQSPRMTLFNLFQYQLLFRRTNWEDATPHDLEVAISWLHSPTAFLLGALAIVGVWHIAKCKPWEGAARAEFLLCGWLALAMGAELSTTHPTFPSYWTLLTPFLGIPAAAGMYAVMRWLPRRVQTGWAVAALALMLALGIAKSLRTDGGRFNWVDMEDVARKVNEVTPPGGVVWADEQTYFLTHRPPVEGTEFAYTEIIDMPEDEALSLHIVSDENLDRQAAQGKFATVSNCEDAEVIERLKLNQLFRKQATVGRGCHVFWDPTGAAAP